MTDYELIKEMYTMQQKLDNAIYTAKGIAFSDVENKYPMAIIDELGELTHELKGQWCWWKNTQKPVDNKRVLEELVDVWHFVMGYTMNKVDLIYWNVEEYIKMSINSTKINHPVFVSNLISWIISGNMYSMLRDLILLTLTLGFSIQDVYDEYLKKNKVNYDRLNSGY